MNIERSLLRQLRTCHRDDGGFTTIGATNQIDRGGGVGCAGIDRSKAHTSEPRLRHNQRSGRRGVAASSLYFIP